MDGILATPASADTRTDEQWIEDQIYELRARSSGGTGGCISNMAEIRAFKRVLDRIEMTKKGTAT